MKMDGWRPIPSAPGYFANERGEIRGKSGLVLNPWLSPSRGYYRVSIHAHGKQKIRDIHILVCEAFHGPKPTDKHECLHLDETRTNNVPPNLKWGTRKENLNAPGFIAKCKSRTGENSATFQGRRRKEMAQ